jgi:alkane 1-monooxygenase
METWRDHKRYLWLVALLMPVLPFLAMGLFHFTGMAVWLWLGPLVILGLVPILDLLAGLDRANPPDDALEALEKDRYYRWITYLFLPLQYAGFITALWFIANGGLTTMEKIGLATTVGFIGGLGINTAHELGHKKESHERWLSKIALAQSCYGHFYIEHNRGHHVRVATPEDPASSRVGESFYRFWPRTVYGSLKSAWNLERQRYARRHQHPFRIGNDVLNSWLMTFVLWAVMILWLGAGIIPFLLIQALVGITLLEAVNYLEHYGMLRQKVMHGNRERYEQIDPRHSWNSNNLTTNVLLYHLQRHSDHHARPTRRYQALRDYEESPVLPTGYAGMILLALVPPLWSKVMDPRVAQHFTGNLALANIAPHARTRILHRWGMRNVSSADPRNALPAHLRSETASQCESADSYICPGCGYVFAESRGDAREGFPAGTEWRNIPESWCCPDCGVREKSDFLAATE